MGVAYAYVKNQWVTCISQHYSSLAGHSERELMVASEELRKQNKNTAKQFVVTASHLAEFLSKSEQQEVVLLQRMQDLEAKEIYSASPVNNNSSKQQQKSEVLKLPINQPEIVEAIPEEIKPYEEFW
jgi:putative transposase